MQVEEDTYSPGERINHSDHGAGVVLEVPRDGYLRAFFSGGDRVMADLKYRLAKKLDEEALEMASDPYGSEFASSHVEDIASAAVELHLPEERLRIADLLSCFPRQRETKVQKLLEGLGVLWRQNSNEKIVIFATYLGTVDLLAREIEDVYRRKLIRLAFLSPNLQRAILAGSQPASLTLAKLMADKIPLSWAEQDRRFGRPEQGKIG